MVLLFLLLSTTACAAPAACKDECQIYFSPRDHLAKQLIELIDEEEESLYLATYDLCHRDVIKALQRARQRGVKVEVIVDDQGLSHGDLPSQFLPHSIPLYLWKPKIQKKLLPIMHNKFCIFGKRAVWTGSYNFSYKGDIANRENAIYLTGEEVAERYRTEFLQLKKESKRIEKEKH